MFTSAATARPASTRRAGKIAVAAARLAVRALSRPRQLADFVREPADLSHGRLRLSVRRGARQSDRPNRVEDRSQHRIWHDQRRPDEVFCTPIVIEAAGKTAAHQPVEQGHACLTIPRTGREYWRVRYTSHSGAAMPVYAATASLFINTGFGKADLMAVRPDGEGDVTSTHVVWMAKKTIGSKPSQVVVERFDLQRPRLAASRAASTPRPARSCGANGWAGSSALRRSMPTAKSTSAARTATRPSSSRLANTSSWRKTRSTTASWPAPPSPARP